MKKFHSILKMEDYPEILNDLIESEDENLINQYEKVHLHFNVGFYPYLIAQAEQVINKFQRGSLEHSKVGRIIAQLQNLNNVFPSEGLPASLIYDRRMFGLLDNGETVFTIDKWESWLNRINTQISALPGKLHYPFISWCQGQMKLNRDRHRSICKYDPADCSVDRGYEKRILYLQGLIDDLQEPEPTEQKDEPKKPFAKIQWLGTQRQLAELLIVLKKKGWIEKFEYETIKNCFTESDSIQQYLKPGKDERGEATYPEVFKPGFDERFYGIKKNESK